MEARRHGFVVWTVAVVIAVYFLPLATDTPLLDPDEGLHAAIAQEMVERGDWVTPRLFGEPFLDKPIVFFWAQAASLRLWGMHEAAVRLPGVLFALAGVWTTYWLASTLLGRSVGWLAGIFQATMVLPVAMAQAAVHDVALVPWTNLALGSAWRAMEETERHGRPGRWFAAVGLWLGLAILTKGLIGVALVLLAWGLLVLGRRQLNLGTVLRGLGTLAVAAAVAAPWYLAMEWRNPGYLHYYFVERHLLGYVTDSQRHGGAAWWYYLPILLGGALPWVLFVPAALHEAWVGRRRPEWSSTERALRFLLGWLVSSLVFLTLASSKLLTYLLPVFPAVAILAAWVWDRYGSRELVPRSRRWLGWAVVGLAVVGPGILPVALRVCRWRFGVEWPLEVRGIGAVVSLGMLLPLACWWRGWPRATLMVQTGALAAVLLFISAAVLPRLGHYLSARELAQHLNQVQPAPEGIWIIEERIGSVVFYLSPELRRRMSAEHLRPLSWTELGRMPAPPGNVWLALPDKRRRAAQQYLDLTQLRGRAVGHYQLCPAAELLAARRTGAGPAEPRMAASSGR